MTDAEHLPAERAPTPAAEAHPSFASVSGFELMQRASKLLASSDLVPSIYRSRKEIKEYGKVIGYEDNPSAVSNCALALNLASRMRADVLMVMQNLNIIEGRPTWSSQYVIAAINACSRFTSLRFELSEWGPERPIQYEATEYIDNRKTRVKKEVIVRDRSIVAWALEKNGGARLQSPPVTIEMAVKEGWLTKSGSKWQTMPELMLHYRSGAFFGRLYAPEILLGLPTDDEVLDMVHEPVQVIPDKQRAPAALTASIQQHQAAPEPQQAAAAAPVAPPPTRGRGRPKTTPQETAATPETASQPPVAEAASVPPPPPPPSVAVPAAQVEAAVGASDDLPFDMD